MSMFIRKLKHSMLIGLMKTLSGLAPAASYMAFAGSGSSRQLCDHTMRSGAKRVCGNTPVVLKGKLCKPGSELRPQRQSPPAVHWALEAKREGRKCAWRFSGCAGACWFALINHGQAYV